MKRLQSVLCNAPTLLDDVDPNAACPVRVTGPVFSKKRAARPQPQKPVLNGRSTGHSGHVRTLPLLAESGETLRAPIVDKSEAEPLLFLGEVSSDARPQRVNGHGPRPLLDPGVPESESTRCGFGRPSFADARRVEMPRSILTPDPQQRDRNRRTR